MNHIASAQDRFLEYQYQKRYWYQKSVNRKTRKSLYKAIQDNGEMGKYNVVQFYTFKCTLKNQIYFKNFYILHQRKLKLSHILLRNSLPIIKISYLNFLRSFFVREICIYRKLIEDL